MLATELRKLDGSIRLLGLGGSRMREAGVRLLADLDRLAVMGISEVAAHLPYLFRLRRRVRRRLLQERVDLLIPIDYPGFNLPLAGFARRHAIPVLYYVAPQVWAWRETRARRLAAVTDLVCAIFPFEVGLLARYGAEVRFVGHPLLDVADDHGADTPSRRAEPGPPTLALFPGSRPHEVRRMLPNFLDAARRVREVRPEVRIVVGRASHLSGAFYREAGFCRVDTAARAIEGATAALCKSGTVTLELALAGVPMVVGHRLSPLTYAIARGLVKVEHVSLVNLVAGQRLVPELLQHEMSPRGLADGVLPFLEPGSTDRKRVVEGLVGVRERLGTPGCARRVAEHAAGLLAARSRR